MPRQTTHERSKKILESTFCFLPAASRCVFRLPRTAVCLYSSVYNSLLVIKSSCAILQSAGRVTGANSRCPCTPCLLVCCCAKPVSCNSKSQAMKGSDRKSTLATAAEPDTPEFPYRAVIILVLCLTVHRYTFVNVFPYVGMMVKRLMGLSSTNESGETETVAACALDVYSVSYRLDDCLGVHVLACWRTHCFCKTSVSTTTTFKHFYEERPVPGYVVSVFSPPV